MPKQNLLLFILVASLIVSGWLWLKFSWLAPEKTDKAEADQTTAKDKKVEQPGKDEAKDAKKEQAEVDLTRVTAGYWFGRGIMQGVAPVGPPAADAVVDIPLGDPADPTYFVVATISTRGGGIRNLTLPKFQKANATGQPVFNADGSRAPLQLIGDDPFSASFLLFHYPVPDKTDRIGDVLNTLGERIWKVESKSVGEVVLYCDQVPGYPGLKIVKTYSLEAKTYHVGLKVEFQDLRDAKGPDKAARAFRYQMAGSHGMPVEGEFYSSVYRTPMIGVLHDDGRFTRDLEETQMRISQRAGGERFPLGSLGSSRIQYGGVSTQYFASLIVPDNEQADTKFLEYCRPTLETEERHGTLIKFDDADPKRAKLIIRTQEQFARDVTFLLVPAAVSMVKGIKLGDTVFVSSYDPEWGNGEFVGTNVRVGTVRRRQLDDITTRVVSRVLQLEPGKPIVHKYLLYHGPSKVRLMAQFTGDMAVDPALVERYSDTLHLRTLTDYRSPGPFGWFASQIYWTDVLITTTRFMHWLLEWLHYFVPNYGLSIILLTLIVRGALFPVSRHAAKVSQRMQAIAPEMKRLQEKYKDDPQAKTAAVLELYRKNGVNPFGSCVPMLMQLPFFLGLYYCLQESIHFRLASFLWIDNLAAPDMLLYWGEGIPIISDPDNYSGGLFSIFYLGPYFNLLPIFAVVLTVLQQKMLMPPPVDEQQEMQQKMMKYMAVVIGIMFYKVAAGLCLYFIVSSLWGLCERKLLPKKQPPAGATTTAATPPASGGPAKPSRGKGKPDKKEKKPDTTAQKLKDWWADVLRQAEKK
jgi:YidC/Oxa1 family membrane protein insertase